MTTLREALSDYLRIRRGLGFELREEGRMLAGFVEFMERASAERITTRLALGWATQGRAHPHWHRRQLGLVRGFARYVATLDPVNGVIWQYANAANVVEQALLDFMIGIVNDDYIKHVQERMRYMAPEDREAILDAIRSPSVLDRILEEVSLTPEDVLAMPVDVLAARLQASPEMCRTLLAFRDFKAAAAAASGAHFELIIEYLVKSEDGTGGRRAVDPGHGTGGRTHADTKRVQEMRAKHPVAHKICIATRLAWPPKGGPKEVEA